MSNSWRVHVENSNVYDGMLIYMSLKTDDGVFVVKRMMTEVEKAEPAIRSDPALVIEDRLAHELYRALAAHFGDATNESVYRQLRNDYVHERDRVDKFINILLRNTAD